MTTYTAPLRDMRFVMEELCGMGEIATLPGLADATPDLVAAVLEEAAKVAGEVLAPINQQGDVEGSRLVDGHVTTPPGWKEAYTTFIEGGWNGAVNEPEWGGMGLPWLVNVAVQEMFQGANMAFSLCPMLTQGAIEAISLNGSEELKQRFLPKMVAGEWTGTMNLTEPQAGSDLGAVRTRAERAEGHYLISGQKIFITYGDHDLTANIIHLVLARTPDAPPGVKGISLFVVPKFIDDGNGAAPRPNDVQCVSIEHKLGIHASPTAVMSFGDRGGAVGYLVGEENRGLEYMFVMMNLERLVVGLQALGVSERAYQQAVAYARERIQGQPIGSRAGERLPIIHHPGIRRELMLMRAEIEAMRAVAYAAGRASDLYYRHPDADERARNKARLDLLTPVVKGWCTERSVDLTSINIQIHGGMGYVEETGASQYFRDARITSIYEGTTAIQANDLVGRKIIRDEAKTARALFQEMQNLDPALASNADPAAPVIRAALKAGVDEASRVVDWVLEAHRRDPRLPAAASISVLLLFGTLAGGYEMARAALAAGQRLADGGAGDPDFLAAKIATARFYAQQVMPRIGALGRAIVDGSETALALDTELF
ncbi:MAG: acyl-CoA dehydrogenase [Rhodospirillales bacterium]